MDNLDVIALGGNALLPAGNAGTIEEQFNVTRITMSQIIDLIKGGRNVVLTHGNGPIVGNIVLRNEAIREDIAPMPLDVCGADSQGGIGYMIQQSLRNEFDKNGIKRDVVSIITQVLVSPEDTAFQNPVKPIGPYYSKTDALRLAKEKGWQIVEDSKKGYRRVVPSPRPIDIIEKRVIRDLVSAGVIVITVGGGGIPVTYENGEYRGKEAVIDKDLASAVLAMELGAERLIILTDIDAVYKDFGTPNAKALDSLTISQAKSMLHEGEFPPGSMGHKIEAAIEFLQSGGRSVTIAHALDLKEAVAGNKGTHIVADPIHEHRPAIRKR